MYEYRIISFANKVLLERSHRGDKTAKKWMQKLMDAGTISGVPVQLQRRVLTDADAAKLPPFASGKKQSAWNVI